MTPIISTVVSAATQMISPEATTEIASAGASSFGSILSSAMQSMDKTPAVAPVTSSTVAPEASPAVTAKSVVPSLVVVNETTQTTSAKNNSISHDAALFQFLESRADSIVYRS